MAENSSTYPVKFEVEYPPRLSRLSTFFRLILSIPILVVLSALTSYGMGGDVHQNTQTASTTGGSIVAGLSGAVALMIIFRQRYPRWWFDFSLELNRFSSRVGAYLFLLTDQYPSTVDHQSVHLDIRYPDVKQDLNRWMPLVKWFLAIPHYIVLLFLLFGVSIATFIAWFAILFTGRYPRGLFDYVVGVGRWCARVNAYAFMLATDQYPPFSLSQ